MRLLLATLVLSSFGCVDQANFTPIGQITLTGPEQTLVIRSQGIVEIPISVTRGTGQDGDISLSATGLPQGVEFDPYVLPAGQTQGAVTLRASNPELGGHTVFNLHAQARGEMTATASIKLLTVGAVGAVDAGYGVGGRVSISGNVDRDCRTWQLAGGKLLVDRSPLDGISLTRLLANGEPDAAFGIGGTLSLSPVTGTMARARNTSVFINVLPDDRILVGATGDDPGVEGRYNAVITFRLSKNGTVDSSYGTGGFVAMLGAIRLWGMTATPTGEALLWHNATGSGPMMTRLNNDGSFAATSPYFTAFGVAAADILLQPDGKPVMLVNEGGGYALVRLTNSLNLDPSFGRSGITPVAGVPLRWSPRSDGSFFGVGARYDFPTTGSISAYVAHYQSNWVPVSGFEAGGIALTDVPTFLGSSIETEGGTLASANVEGQARLLFLNDKGRRDLDFGVGGWRTVSTLAAGASESTLTAVGMHNAVLSYSVSGQSCELYRIWK